MINIVIADAQARVRAALRLLLEADATYHVIAETAYLEEIMPLVRSRRPDLILLDWQLLNADLPDDLIADLHKILHKMAVRVIALSSDPNCRDAALSAGADAFVGKSDPPDVLLRTLQQMTVR